MRGLSAPTLLAKGGLLLARGARHSLELTASPLATVTVLDHDAADERGAKAHFTALPYLYHGVKPLHKKKAGSVGARSLRNPWYLDLICLMPGF